MITATKKIFIYTILPIILIIFIIPFCNKENSNSDDNTATDNDGTEEICTSNQFIEKSRGACSQTLTYTSEFSTSVSGTERKIEANNIPNHSVGLFGSGSESLNPNAIQEQNAFYTITTSPKLTNTYQSLIVNGPQYSFGIASNGIEYDPIAAEPFPHKGINDPNVNWEWNLEATNVAIGLDCNNAHVQPNGKYHYHGIPTKYIEQFSNTSSKMTLIGWAADGFPIYYKYGYSNPNDASSAIKELKPSWRLKTGKRPGDGITAPCDTYNGVYSNDYEYVKKLGDLDSANGRTGVTPEYPEGIYYYILTDSFPNIPRYFRGTPSQDFKIGPAR